MFSALNATLLHDTSPAQDYTVLHFVFPSFLNSLGIIFTDGLKYNNNNNNKSHAISLIPAKSCPSDYISTSLIKLCSPVFSELVVRLYCTVVIVLLGLTVLRQSDIVLMKHGAVTTKCWMLSMVKLHDFMTALLSVSTNLNIPVPTSSASFVDLVSTERTVITVLFTYL